MSRFEVPNWMFFNVLALVTWIPNIFPSFWQLEWYFLSYSKKSLFYIFAVFTILLCFSVMFMSVTHWTVFLLDTILELLRHCFIDFGHAYFWDLNEKFIKLVWKKIYFFHRWTTILDLNIHKVHNIVKQNNKFDVAWSDIQGNKKSEGLDKTWKKGTKQYRASLHKVKGLGTLCQLCSL